MLKGTLDDFAVTDVFRLLSASHRTGRLDLERPAGSGKVLFSDGKVVHAETSLSTTLLGQKLIAAGALTEAQVRKALDEQAGTGQRLGEIVVGAGLVEHPELAAALRDQVQDAVFELLQWETGNFAWEPAASVDDDIGIPFEVEDLIAEVVKRLDEMEKLQERIPSTGSIPVMASKPPEGAEAITLSPLEWQTVVLVNGSRSVSEIAVSMGRTEIDTMRTLFSLVSAGLVEMRPTGDEPATGERPEALQASEPPIPAERMASADTEVVVGAGVSPETEPVGPEQPSEPREISRADEDPVLEPAPAASEVGVSEDWFDDPADALEPMSTGDPDPVDVGDVTVTVDDASPGTEDDGRADEEHVAFPDPDAPVVDRAAAARELSGLLSDESRKSRPPSAAGDDEEENEKGILSRLMNKP
jgi:hypothetical protein